MTAEQSSRLAEIAERHGKATPGEWNRSGIVHKREGVRHFTVLAGDLVLFEISAGRSDEYYAQSRSDADFIAHAHQDVPWLIAELAAERERSLKLVGLLRDAEKRLSVHATTMDANLTNHGCALCGSWVWDDSEENIKPIAHKPDCLITKLRTAADDLSQRDVSASVSGEGGANG